MSRIRLHAYILTILLALATLGAKSGKPLSLAGRPKTDFSRIPMDFSGWVGREGRFPPGTEDKLPSASLLVRVYQRGEEPPIELAIVYGTDLGDFHQPEFCLEGQGWRTVSKTIVNLKPSGLEPTDAVTLTMEHPEAGKGVFLYWFASESATSTSLGNYKMKILWNRLRGRAIRPSALVRIYTPIAFDEGDAIALVSRFAEAIAPYLRSEFTAPIH